MQLTPMLLTAAELRFSPETQNNTRQRRKSLNLATAPEKGYVVRRVSWTLTAGMVWPPCYSTKTGLVSAVDAGTSADGEDRARAERASECSHEDPQGGLHEETRGRLLPLAEAEKDLLVAFTLKPVFQLDHKHDNTTWAAAPSDLFRGRSSNEQKGFCWWHSQYDSEEV